jgi:hypothetical protein
MSNKLWREHYNQAFGPVEEASSSKTKKKFHVLDSNVSSGRNGREYKGTSSSSAGRASSGETQSRDEQDMNSESIRGRPSLPVNAINLRTGVTVKRYKSLKAATMASGTTYDQISRCCQGFIPDAGGLGWQYASGKDIEIMVIFKILILSVISADRCCFLM